MSADEPQRAAPGRLVSLVPSVTEALFALGLGERVVGVTDWCVHPAEGVAALPKVGGTKDTDVEAVVRLAPDLVLANHEENTRRTVAALEAAGLNVRVSYPRTVAEGVELLAELHGLGASPDAWATVVEPARQALAAKTYFEDALRWMEIHGGPEGQELAAHWRRLPPKKDDTASEAQPADDEPKAPPRKRRRRRRRPGASSTARA